MTHEEVAAKLAERDALPPIGRELWELREELLDCQSSCIDIYVLGVLKKLYNVTVKIAETYDSRLEKAWLKI